MLKEHCIERKYYAFFMPNMKGNKSFKSLFQSSECMQNNFNRNSFDVCQLFTPSLNVIYVSAMRTCSAQTTDCTKTGCCMLMYFRYSSLSDSGLFLAVSSSAVLVTSS